jgi:osmotically-inducible protein OsmY
MNRWSANRRCTRCGVVTLAGWVDSYTKRWAAEEAAHRVRGVVAVANDIEVRLPSSAERTDPEIAAAAKRALEWDTSVPLESIEVTVTKGWVTLRGEVEWQYQRQDAERAVRRLAGVRGVTNLIQVKPRIRPSAEELRQKIEDALVRSARTDAERITVGCMGTRSPCWGPCDRGPRSKRQSKLPGQLPA